jgi:hypothetical protein
MTKTENKKIGGVVRARKAREELILALQEESHPMYLAKDIDLAKKFDVSRHTIYKIRDDYEIPSRTNRILTALKGIDMSKYTIKELSDRLGVKYQNLYRIIKDNGLTAKSDTPPIESLKEYQKSRKEV